MPRRSSPTSSLHPIGKSSLTLRVCDAIKAYIVSENLAPGSALPSEREMSASLVVSRTIVREALSLLVGEGLVVKKPGSGIFMSHFDRRALVGGDENRSEEDRAHYRAIREARAAVEMGAIGLIVERIGESELAELVRILDAVEPKIESGEASANEDLQFHLGLLRAAHNEILLRWTPLVEEVMRDWAYRVEAWNHPFGSAHLMAQRRRDLQDHRTILDAVRARDPEGARQALRAHFKITAL